MEIISSENLQPKGEKYQIKRSVVEGADCCEATLSE